MEVWIHTQRGRIRLPRGGKNSKKGRESLPFTAVPQTSLQSLPGSKEWNPAEALRVYERGALLQTLKACSLKLAESLKTGVQEPRLALNYEACRLP